MSTPLENCDFELSIAAERFNRAVTALNFEQAAAIQETKDLLLDKRLRFMQMGITDGPQEAA